MMEATMTERACGLVAIVAALTMPSLATADGWQQLGSFHGSDYSVDASTIQRSQRADTKTPAIGVWVRVKGGSTFQIWVDCAERWSATYYQPPSGWTQWAPIPPETAEWAVWEYLCHKKAKTSG